MYPSRFSRWTNTFINTLLNTQNYKYLSVETLKILNEQGTLKKKKNELCQKNWLYGTVANIKINNLIQCIKMYYIYIVKIVYSAYVKNWSQLEWKTV